MLLLEKGLSSIYSMITRLIDARILTRPTIKYCTKWQYNFFLL